MCPPKAAPSVRSPRPPASTTAAALRSRERGTWPLARASSRRFCVGVSVRSFSSSAMASGPQTAAGEGRNELERGLHQFNEAGLHARQAEEQYDQTEDQRQRQANRKHVEGGRGTTHRTKGEID